jgi:hypothetical protein
MMEAARTSETLVNFFQTARRYNRQESRRENLKSYLVFFWLLIDRSLGSSVSIVSDYGLDDRGSIPDRGRGFFF